MIKEIKPSQFYIVRASTALQDCLYLMKSKSLSFLLIEDRDGKLNGIFTLKDLLKNHQHLISFAKRKKPIRVFMTKPVMTISSSQLHKAPELMINKNIRHLPITSGGKEGSDIIIGVIDMESLLAYSLEDKKKVQYQGKELLVYSPNGSLLRFLRNVLKKYEHVQLDKLWASKIKTSGQVSLHLNEYDLLIFDLLDEKSLKLALAFSQGLRGSKKQLIGLVDSTLFTEDSSREDLVNLSKMNRVKIFEKPVNVHDLIFACIK